MGSHVRAPVRKSSQTLHRQGQTDRAHPPPHSMAHSLNFPFCSMEKQCSQRCRVTPSPRSVCGPAEQRQADDAGHSTAPYRNYDPPCTCCLLYPDRLCASHLAFFFPPSLFYPKASICPFHKYLSQQTTGSFLPCCTLFLLLTAVLPPSRGLLFGLSSLASLSAGL